MSLDRGILLLQTGRHELAEREFRAALGAEPTDAWAHTLLAMALLPQEKFDEAEEAAGQAVGLRPDWDGGYAAMAAVLRDRGRLPEAAHAIGRAVGLDPFNPGHRAVQAEVALERRRWAEALAAADEGLAIDAQHAGCVNARGAALVQLGRKDEAAATIQGALAKNPQSAASHANQGWALLHAGDHRAALEHFREALRINPNSEAARAGTVEALKARHLVYRVMLRYFLFMSRLPRQAQWAIVVGGYFGFRGLNEYADRVPAARPFVLPVLGLYLLFAVMTWLAAPLFNLLLRLNRFGRHALSRDQRVASNWLVGCFAVALGLGLTWAVTRDGRYGLATLIAAVMAIPVSAVFRCPAGWPRVTMGAYTAVLAAVGVVGVAPDFVPGLPITVEQQLFLFQVFGYGGLLANLAANYLAFVVVRR